MPWSLNGCGTRYYGGRDQAEDGSYVTTLWASFVWLPIVPLASYRVIPTGEGVDILIYSSAKYVARRVPLCWRQVRNTYLAICPILVVLLLLLVADKSGWFSDNESAAARAVIHIGSTVPAPKEEPLSQEDANKACGAVLNLDDATSAKLNVHKRLSDLVNSTAFTQDEIEGSGSTEQLEQDAFKAYSLGYMTWDDAKNETRAKAIKEMRENFISQRMKTAAANRVALDAYIAKDDRLTLNAFDLGRHDARTSPCHF